IEDWDWSLSIDENTLKGALPTDGSLRAARLVITLFLPLSLVFIYLAGINLSGRWAGLIAVLLYGMNSLVLLHGRRAMTEGPYLLGVILLIWALSRSRTSPILVGAAFALALNSKLTALFLLPAALVAILWQSNLDSANLAQRRLVSRAVLNLGAFSLVILTISGLLNPVFWGDPLHAFQLSISERQKLLAAQVQATSLFAPNQVLISPIRRLIALIANVFILEPSFSEIGNYADWSAPVEASYLARPESSVLRGLVGGGVVAALFVFGLIASTLQSIRGKARASRRIVLVLIATLCQFSGLLLAIQLPWQRYTIGFVPFVSIWIALGLVAAGRTVRTALTSNRNPETMESLS
ncbi:MAG: glycosyltransferase family 39 protein, partial [Anaerolineales bacterium]|nr:glycosyltransferase family 39 protein [Anaerolineales bacterium]